MEIEAVIFDLDNTLTHRNKTINKCAKAIIQQFDLVSSPDNLTQILSIIHSIDQGGYPKRELLTHPSIAASVAQALIEVLPWKTIPDLHQLTNFWFENFPKNAVEMSFASEVLNHLKEVGFKLAVISNGQHASRLKTIQSLGFESFFDCIISSEKAGISKPNLEIFNYTATKLNVENQRCLFIGDHPHNDYYGAKNAGMDALLLAGFNKEVDQSMQTIASLKEILFYLKKA